MNRIKFNQMKPYYSEFPIIVAIVTILAIILPSIIGYEFSAAELRGLSEVLMNDGCHDVFLAFLVSCTPLIIGTTLDYFDGFKSDIDLKCWYSRLIITTTALIVGIQFTIIRDVPDMFHLTSSRATSYLLSFSCLRVVVTCGLMTILHTLKPEQFTNFLTSSIASIISIIICLRTFLPGLGHSYALAITIIQSILIAIILGIVVWWYYPLICNRHHLLAADYKCLLYLSTFTISLYGTFIAFFKRIFLQIFSYTSSDISSSDILASIIIYCFFLTFLSLTPSRISRFESINALKNIIETKKAYVQFISHELRTPLNTVFLGLKLSVDQIPEDTEDENEQERRDTLLEMSSACHAALDILNELLLYDKLESGILVLNRLVVKVSDLVHESMKMFSVQVKEKNIELYLTNNSTVTLFDRDITASSSNLLRPSESSHSILAPNRDSILHMPSKDSFILSKSMSINSVKDTLSTCTCIYEHDEIDVDKNKIQQVIRNVLSNAIKFTPEGGKIQVNMKFQPDSVPTLTNLLLSGKNIKKCTERFNLNRGAQSLNTTISPSPLSEGNINQTAPIIAADNSVRNLNNTISGGNYNNCDINHGIDYKHVIDIHDGSSWTNQVDHNDSGHQGSNDSPNAYMHPNNSTNTNNTTTITTVNAINNPDITSATNRNTNDPPTTTNTLASNAMNTAAAAVDMTMSMIQGKLIIEIYDTGAGISAENQKKLFHEIVQFSPELLQNGGGSGLGMWITRGIVDLHQGNINVYSPGEGKGSRFTFGLPMTRHPTLTQTSELLPEYILINSESAISHGRHHGSGHTEEGITTNSADRLNTIHVQNEGNIEDYALSGPYRKINNTTGRNNLDLEERIYSSSDTMNMCTNNTWTYDRTQHCKVEPNSNNISSVYEHESNLDSSKSNHSETMNREFFGNHSSSKDSQLQSSSSTLVRPVTVFNTMAESHNTIICANDVSQKDTSDQQDIHVRTPKVPLLGLPPINTQLSTHHTAEIQIKSSHNNSNSSSHVNTERSKTSSSIQNKVTVGPKKVSPTRHQSVVANGYHLLIVDDSSMNRKMLVKLFTAQGYTCSEAKDGLEAYEVMKAILDSACRSSKTIDSILSEGNPSETSIAIHTDESYSYSSRTCSTLYPSNPTSGKIIMNTDTYTNTGRPDSHTNTGRLDSHINTERDECDKVRLSTHQIPSYYYDAIIMDNQMPNMDGPTSAKNIRALGYSGIIVGVTGNALPKDIEEFIQCGANTVLPKPLDMDIVNQVFQGKDDSLFRVLTCLDIVCS